MFLLGFTELVVKYIVNNDMKLINNNKNKSGKSLEFIFKGENLVKQSYMGTFRKNIINLIYKMAKDKKNK